MLFFLLSSLRCNNGDGEEARWTTRRKHSSSSDDDEEEEPVSVSSSQNVVFLEYSLKHVISSWQFRCYLPGRKIEEVILLDTMAIKMELVTLLVNITLDNMTSQYIMEVTGPK